MRNLSKLYWSVSASVILVTLIGSPPPASASNTAAPPKNLRCEYLINPVGIDVRQPRFQWVLEDENRGEKQTAYQILVASNPRTLADDRGDQWDSEKVMSQDSTQVVYEGIPLVSGETYYWKVRWWDREGNVSLYSKPAKFEMGLLFPSEWKGKWIAGGSEFRKIFELRGLVERARVYVAAIGYYELRINGRKVGDGVLDPGWTTYSKRVLYSTYDITDHLKAGTNAVAVLLGGGWATQKAGRLTAEFKSPAFRLQMNIELDDGKGISIESDGSWKVTSGPLVSNSIYDGEIYDARLETPDWDQPHFDESSWKPAQEIRPDVGVLSAEVMPPIRVVDTLVPKVMASPAPGVYVYDFGQNISGWVRLRVRGPRGTVVKLRFSELVYPSGMINRENLRAAKSRDLYVLRGQGTEIFEPHFTYHGFRYVEMKGYPGTPSLDSIRARVAHTAVQTIGGFTASNQILNQIQRLVYWSQLTNLFSIPTDCDQRDERQGWMGDAQVSAEEAMMNFDMAAFYTNFIRDIRDAQQPDGSVPDTVPHKYGRNLTDPAWGTAYPLLCWYMWQQYGDRRILRENYERLKKYIGFLRSHATEDILRYSFYGDWISIDPTPGALISDAYFYLDVKILAVIAKVLGGTEDSQAYGKLAERIKVAFNSTFFNAETGEYANGTQTAQVLPLYFGLVPERGTGKVVAHLYRDIVYKHNTHLTTGFIGVKYLLPVLSQNGYPDVAYELATQKTYPSWGYMIEHGATTLWELWQEKTGPSMNSHDHAMLGSVGAWFYRALGGIDLEPDGEGYRHLRIEPKIVEDLQWASASIYTIRGLVASSWDRSSGATNLAVTVPVNSDAVVVVPVPEEMTISNVNVREDGHVVWEKGHLVPGDSGIARAYAGQTEIFFQVGSGQYTFRLTGGESE